MPPRVLLTQLPAAYAISRLDAAAPIPGWADGQGFVSISRSDDELSIVCRQERVPEGMQTDDGWTCFKLQGPFAFGETGIVLSVIRPLSENNLGVFLVSTFDGDHLLVKTADVDAAIRHLTAAGHTLS